VHQIGVGRVRDERHGVRVRRAEDEVGFVRESVWVWAWARLWKTGWRRGVGFKGRWGSLCVDYAQDRQDTQSTGRQDEVQV
jgi:hypothetical protein